MLGHGGKHDEASHSVPRSGTKHLGGGTHCQFACQRCRRLILLIFDGSTVESQLKGLEFYGFHVWKLMKCLEFQVFEASPINNEFFFIFIFSHFRSTSSGIQCQPTQDEHVILFVLLITLDSTGKKKTVGWIGRSAPCPWTKPNIAL